MFILQMAQTPLPPGVLTAPPRRVNQVINADPSVPVLQPQPAPQPGFWERMGQLYSDGLRIMGNGGPPGSY